MTEPALPAVRPDGSGVPTSIGPFSIIRVLGQGGMGVVYLADDPMLHRKVALKVPKHLDQKPEARERFLREARTAAQFEHPNFCRIYRIDEAGGVPYLVMEYIEGKELAKLIAPGQPWEFSRAAEMVHKLAEALESAHHKGVIHRDLKPQNIMIAHDGRLVLMDFGLARVIDGDDYTLTPDGLQVGTPSYMSPEQAKPDLKAIGPRSDIYSLGVILYELLTGARPFVGSPWQILSQVIVVEPPPPTKHNPSLDSDLAAVVIKAMAKKPEDRFATMGEFAGALRKWLESCRNPESDLNLSPSASPPSSAISDSLTNSVGMRLISIPVGEFLMGSDESDPKAYPHEKPRHPVRITRAFDLGAHPVTQGQYWAVTGRNPSYFQGSAHLPVEQVSWLAAVAFCIEISKREGLRPCYESRGNGLPDGNGYRLPTEAEWEYACRAGSLTRFYFGEDPATLGDHAWFVGNAKSKTHPVGRKRANNFGLHDMIGNVWEWCADAYDDSYYQHSPTDDPTGPSRGSRKVFRGGSWNGGSHNGRSADRGRGEPDVRDKNLGFRVVRVRSR